MSSNKPFEPLDLSKFDLSSLEVATPTAASTTPPAAPAADATPTFSLENAEVKGLNPDFSAMTEHHKAAGKGVQNVDGTTSTVRTIIANIDGKETVIPTVWDGQILSNKAAIDQAVASGKRWPAFASVSEAEAADTQWHREQGLLSAPYSDKLKQLEIAKALPRTFSMFGTGAPEDRLQTMIQDDLSTMELRGEDLDTGLPAASLLDKIKSFTTSFGISAARTGIAPLQAIGAAGLMDDQDYRIWQNQPPEEQRKTQLSKAMEWISKLGMYDEAGSAGGWGLANAGDIEARAKVQGEAAGAVLNDVLTRLDNLEKSDVLPGFWTDQLPQATGTTAAFLLAGTAGEIATGGAVAAWATAGFLGAALGAEQGVEDAVSAGATPSQARIASGVGLLLGTTEALPVIRILDRADNATGGVLSRKLNRVFQQKLVGGVLREGLKGAIEEGLQEMGQQLGQDVTAELTYDPDRDIMGNLTKAGEVAGASGFLLSAAATALGIPLRKAQQKLAQATIRDEEMRRVVGNTADTADLPLEQLIDRNTFFSPLTPAYKSFTAEASQNLDDIEAIAAGYKEQQILTIPELSETLGKDKGYAPQDVGVNFSAGHLLEKNFFSHLEKYQVNLDIESDLNPTMTNRREVINDRWTRDPGAVPGEDFAWAFHPNNDDEETILGGIDDLTERWLGTETLDEEEGPGRYIAHYQNDSGDNVEIGKFDNLEQAQLAVQKALSTVDSVSHADVADALTKQPVVVAGFNEANVAFKNAEEMMKAWMAQNQEKLDHPDSIKTREMIQKRIDDARSAANFETTFAKKAKNIIAGLREQYFSPNTKFVLSGADFASGDKYGAMWSARDGELVQIGINLPNISYEQKGDNAKAMTMATEVLLHEAGHALVNQRLVGLQQKVEATLKNEAQLQNLIKTTESPVMQLHWSDIAALKNRAKTEGKSPATVADLVLYRGIMQEYVTWASNKLAEPGIERYESISPPTFVDSARKRGQVEVRSHYHYNFDEFMAENFARVGTQNEIATKSVRNFFREHRAQLESMYSHVADLPNMPIFERWIQHMSNEGRLAEEVKKQAGIELDMYSILRSPEKARELGINPDMMKGFQEGNDKYQKWYRWGLNILQLGRLNPHITPLQDYIRLTNLFNQRIGRFRWRGHNTLTDWRKVGSNQATKIGDILTQETIVGVGLSPDQMKAQGLSQDSVEVVAQIKDDLKVVMDRMTQVLIGEVQQNFSHDPVLLEQEMKKLNKELDSMRSKPFFPLMRFGRYTVSVRDSTGKLVEFQTFETERDRRRNLQDIRARHTGATVDQSYLTDSQAAIQGMPGPILRALRKKLSDTGNLSREMEDAIDSLLQDALPIESFRNHFARRRKIAGYSEDAMRGYATYIVQAATHLARIELQGDLNQQVNDLKKDARAIDLRVQSQGGRNTTKRAQIANMAGEHLNYMMNPQNDWPMLRSVGFGMALGFNLKSAFVNGTQIILATQPYLAARFGDLEATKALAKAVDLHTAKFKGKQIPQGVAQLLEEGKSQGWLDESFATELAVARSTKYTTDVVPMTSGTRIWTKFMEIGAWPFHTVEKMNRNLTAIATYNLYTSTGMEHPSAVQMAREAVQATQGEYAKWARPKLMQGKIGANIFLFKGYTQNQLFLALGNDPAASRVLFSTLVLAGLLGLPFAEDLLDLLDVVGTKLKRSLGWANPKVQSRLFIRDMIREMQMNPDLFMYGLGESSMGLGFLGDMTGFPIPEVDIQGSLSMGNIIPGTSALKKLQAGDNSAALLDFLREAGGAEASYLGQVANGILSDNPDQWRQWEVSMPAFLRNLARSGRYAQRSGEFDNRGQPIAEFDPTNTQDQMEVAAQAFGFTPSRVNKGWDEYMAEREVVAYYESWRRSTMGHFNSAYTNEDDGNKEHSMDEVRNFNESVPYPEMRISSEVLNKSLEEYARQRAIAGKSLPAKRSEIRLTSEIREKYSE